MDREPTDTISPNQKRRRRPRVIHWLKADPSKIQGRDALSEEMTTYALQIRELLKRRGQYVVIKGSEVIGVFPDRETAAEAAVERFGTAAVLIKQIVSSEPVRSLGGIAL
jgi:hypothetical protein